MYVTRPLSLYLKDELALYVPPPERNSGYLVISDEESEVLLSLRRDYRMRRLPFFQNKDFIVDSYSDGETHNQVLFIPVLNRPLSDNRYYVMFRDRWERNAAATSLKEDEIVTGCGGCCIEDASPRALNPFNTYQQFEINQKPRDRFQAKSMAADGVPPLFLREPWKPYVKTYTFRHPLHEALGLNSSLRSQLPHLNFSSSHGLSQPVVVVGNWYCPFMFVRDKGKKTTFYEMTLEQKWVRVFSKENDDSTGEKGVHVEVSVRTEVAKIAGRKDAFLDERDVASGFVWFIGSDRGGEEVVGLSKVIIERMKWEQERVGWVCGTNGTEKIERVEEFEGSGTWRKFSCYLLVESFVLKRKDKSLVITCDFNHTHQVRCQWE